MVELLLGLISDSHDNLPKIDAAVKKLNSLNVDQVLHAGDYSAPFAAFRYKELKAKMYGVFGNNDAEREKLQENFQSIGHQVRDRFATFEIDKIKIALLHGDEAGLLQALKGAQAYDLIVYGHTHSLGKTQEGRTMIVNPGEICGYLSGKSTIATFDTQMRYVEILEI